MLDVNFNFEMIKKNLEVPLSICEVEVLAYDSED